MTKAKHTPGPWWADFDGEDTFDGVEIQQVGRLHYVPVANVPVDYTDREEREANARLIAAAPDLLDALEEAVSQHGHGLVNLDAARTALAKAKGETP